MSTTIARGGPPAALPRTRFRARLERHPLTAFFVLAYASSWLLWLAPALGLRGVGGALLLYLGVFGPAFAAASVTRLTGGSVRAWLRGLRGVASVRWYAAALLLPLPLVAAASGIYALTGRSLDAGLLGERLAAYVPILLIWTLAAMGEEPGWRGFALPRLQRLLPPVYATALLGGLWALWHLPLLAAADEPSHGLAAGPLVAVSLGTVAAIVGYSFFYTYFWNRTRSTWLAILLHGSFTAANGAFVLVALDDQVGGTYAALQFGTTATLLVAAFVLVRRTHGRLGLEPADVVGRPTHAASHLLRRADVRLTLGAAVPVLSGLALAAAMPRGPVTTAGALGALAVGAAAGLLSGLVVRSRWTLLSTPVLLVAAFETARAGAEGPTVDAPALGTSYGVLAFLLGRGFFGVVVLAPAAVGAIYGCAAGRTRSRRFWARVRRVATAAATLGLAALAIAIARPASTPPVLGPGGEPVAGALATLERVRIGGVEQWISVRGHDPDNPVLLYLSGGPGQTDYPQTRMLLRDLEDDVTVVNWDERGVGKSYAQLDAELTVARVVDDTIALAEHLRSRFDERRIYLLGESWGSVLGVLAVQRRPDLFHAYIGTGQMVDIAETDRRLYDAMLAWAGRTGEEDVARKMREFGRPPYDSIWANAYVMGYYEKLVAEWDVLPYVEARYEEDPYGPWGVLGSEYTLVDRVNVLRGLIDSFDALYPQLQDIDFRRDATRLDVPVYLVVGGHELPARAELVPDWFGRLSAPEKRLVRFRNAGHAPAFEDFRRFERLLVDTVLPATYEKGLR